MGIPMTHDQHDILTRKLLDIQTQLSNFRIPAPSSDDYEANQLIADTRLRLENIDTQLFQCFYLLDRFMNRPMVRATRTPTIDDLEI
jgi:hypothetical protein